MKCLAGGVLMILCVTAGASDVVLTPVATPQPEFPAELLKARYSGKIFAHVTIGSTGTAQAIRVIESSHEQFSQAVLTALRQWRFEPWQVDQGQPGEVAITLPIIFGAQGFKVFSGDVSVGLENVTCAYLNAEVRASKKDYPGEPLSEVDVFWYNRYYLSSSYVVHRVPEKDARQRLYSALHNAIPRVVKGCAKNSKGKYSDYLPEELRSLLVL